MSGEEPVFTSEARSVDLVNNGLNMLANLLGVGCREEEVGNSDPGLVASVSCSELELLGDLGVLSCVVVSTLDPDHGDIGALGCGVGLDEHDRLSHGRGLEDTCYGEQKPTKYHTFVVFSFLI